MGVAHQVIPVFVTSRDLGDDDGPGPTDSAPDGLGDSWHHLNANVSIGATTKGPGPGREWPWHERRSSQWTATYEHHRAGYRPYIEQAHLDAYDAWVLQQESIGAPEHGGLKPGFDATAQWDSELRLKELESQGVVAEVLFPNGLPFESRPDEDGAFASPELTRQARLAYNRWLVDFCRQRSRTAGGTGGDLLRRHRPGRR